MHLATFLVVFGVCFLQIQGCPSVVSRAEWGARPPRSVSFISSAVPRAVVHHTAGTPCFDLGSCSSRVRGIQNYHMDSNGWADIGYSFLIGEDGRVYEGRGWGVQGAHTAGYNSVSYGFSVMGTFTSSPPNSAARQAVRDMIQCGVDRGHIRGGYNLAGHRDCGSTSCPGDALYADMASWPNFGWGTC